MSTPVLPVAHAFAARIAAREERWLSPLAARSYPARRRWPEPDCALRTPFQRDRDRIVHSKAFRRLKHKTQVFVAPQGDHYRTRLTHTLEVTGVSRTVARALALNEDLTEAIGLGHDLGHAPFGHLGENTLDACLRERFGRRFRHNEHSLRVVDALERGAALGRDAVAERSAGVRGCAGAGLDPPEPHLARPEVASMGLNLCEPVRDGILNHSGHADEPATLEGRIVRLVDRIAYINHDIDDALRAGVLHEDELPRDAIRVLGTSGSRRIDTLVHDLVEHSEAAAEIRQGDEVGEAMDALRAFMFERVYLGVPARREQQRVDTVLGALFAYFCEHPQELPAAVPTLSPELADRVTDYLAGMTDRFAISAFQELAVPHALA